MLSPSQPILPPAPTTAPDVSGPATTQATSQPATQPVFTPSQFVASIGLWLSLAYLGGLIAIKTAWRSDRLPNQDTRPAADGLILWAGAGVMFAGQFAVLNVLLRPLQMRFEGSSLLDEVTMLVIVASYAFGLAAVVIVHHSRGWAELASMGIGRMINGIDVGRGLTAALFAIPVTNAALYLTQWLWQALSYQTESVHTLLKVIGREQSQPLTVMLTILVACVLAPVFEELMFRGHVQTAIGLKFPRLRWVPIVGTSIVFAAVHDAWSMPPIFVLSLMLGWAYERTGSLWTSILMHIAFNASSTIAFLVAQHHQAAG